MAHGLQVYDAAGNLRLDPAARLPKLYGYFQVSYGAMPPLSKSWVLSIPELVSTDKVNVVLTNIGFSGPLEFQYSHVVNNGSITLTIYAYGNTVMASYNVLVWKA